MPRAVVLSLAEACSSHRKNLERYVTLADCPTVMRCCVQPHDIRTLINDNNKVRFNPCCCCSALVLTETPRCSRPSTRSSRGSLTSTPKRPEVRVLVQCLDRAEILIHYIAQTIESMFVLWRMTRDAHWRTHGWNMFQSIVKSAKKDSGYASVSNVAEWPPSHRDSMPRYVGWGDAQTTELTSLLPSYFTAET